MMQSLAFAAPSARVSTVNEALADAGNAAIPSNNAPPAPPTTVAAAPTAPARRRREARLIIGTSADATTATSRVETPRQKYEEYLYCTSLYH